MPIKDIKKPGSLNMDDNPSNLPEGDYCGALNVRVGSSNEQHGEGNVETLRGEVEVILDVIAPFTTYYGDAIGGEFLYSGFSEKKIGNQVWLADNWDDDYPGSKAYGDDEDNADTYGRLYTHNQIMQEDFCPEGYHVPIEADIDELLTFLGGAIIAGGAMKELWTEHWQSPNTGATNSSGFKALPGGMYDTVYKLLGEMGLFWLADEAEPLPPILTEPTDITYTSFFVNWLVSEGATGYRLDVATDEDFTSMVVGYDNLDVGNVLTYEITGLIRGTEYFYRIRSYNEIGISENSEISSITTLINLYNDYFLPSNEELELMETAVYGGGGAIGDCWTSSEFNATESFFVRIITPPSWAHNIKSLVKHVWACRKFIGEAGEYIFGDTGPAGGKIFIVDGLNYYETAPDFCVDSVWSNVTDLLVGTEFTVGTGQANTLAIINQVGHTNSAAKLCDDLVI